MISTPFYHSADISLYKYMFPCMQWLCSGLAGIWQRRRHFLGRVCQLTDGLTNRCLNLSGVICKLSDIGASPCALPSTDSVWADEVWASERASQSVIWSKMPRSPSGGSFLVTNAHLLSTWTCKCGADSPPPSTASRLLALGGRRLGGSDPTSPVNSPLGGGGMPLFGSCVGASEEVRSRGAGGLRKLGIGGDGSV